MEEIFHYCSIRLHTAGHPRVDLHDTDCAICMCLLDCLIHSSNCQQRMTVHMHYQDVRVWCMGSCHVELDSHLPLVQQHRSICGYEVIRECMMLTPCT